MADYNTKVVTLQADEDFPTAQWNSQIYPFKKGEIRAFPAELAEHFIFQSAYNNGRSFKLRALTSIEASPVKIERQPIPDMYVCQFKKADGSLCSARYLADAPELIEHVIGHKLTAAKKPEVRAPKDAPKD